MACGLLAKFNIYNNLEVNAQRVRQCISLASIEFSTMQRDMSGDETCILGVDEVTAADISLAVHYLYTQVNSLHSQVQELFILHTLDA